MCEQPDVELLLDREDPAETFAVFYRRHVDAILRYSASKGLDVEDAADVAAETFLIALSKRYSYRARHDSARLWLLGIATRKLADVYRRRALDVKRHALLDTSSIALTSHDREDYAEVLGAAEEPFVAALGDLPKDQQVAIRSRILQDRSYADIASEMDVSPAAARKRVSRGLRHLRKQVGRNHD